LRGADVVLALDVPSLGVPLGPSVRERGKKKLVFRPPGFFSNCRAFAKVISIIHVFCFDFSSGKGAQRGKRELG